MIQIRDKFFANFFLKKVITNEHVLFALANESGKSLLNKIMSNIRIILSKDLWSFVLLRLVLKQYEVSQKGSREALAHEYFVGTTKYLGG